MPIIVITGSTRGIGNGLAREFLRRGVEVVISGRSAAAAETAAAELAAGYGAERVRGFACDVADFDQVQALWNAAVRAFGRVDIWINNAGISHRPEPLAAMERDKMAEVVTTNILGTAYGCAVALRGMQTQGGGAIYNLEGLGSDGRKVAGLTMYGTTKAALAYLTDSLAMETKGTPILVGAIRPGMVMTDLVTGGYRGREAEWEKVRPILELIASPVEDVIPWIAEAVLANRRNGVVIRRNNFLAIAVRMIRRRLLGRA